MCSHVYTKFRDSHRIDIKKQVDILQVSKLFDQQNDIHCYIHKFIHKYIHACTHEGTNNMWPDKPVTFSVTRRAVPSHGVEWQLQCHQH